MPHYTQLTLAQRYQLEALSQQPIRQLDIAKQLGVSPATISRELTRNRPSKPYHALAAHQRTSQLRQRPAYKLTGSLKEHVLNRLAERHSPEQISGTLALKKGNPVISHEAIYQFIYRQNNTEPQRLMAFLRIRHKKRYKKRGRPEQRGSIPNRVGIEERPAIVETSTEIGHWEGDTVIGADHDGVLLTLVERVTKYTLIVKLPSKHANFLANALIKCLLKCILPVLSITFDNAGPPVRQRVYSTPANARAVEGSYLLCSSLSFLGTCGAARAALMRTLMDSSDSTFQKLLRLASLSLATYLGYKTNSITASAKR